VLFLRALRRAMGGIPAGSILAKQELEFHSALAVDTTVAITVWVGEKLVKRERAFVTIEFDIRTENDAPVVTGRKIIVWPTGPEE
jgi:acyl-CoA thioesterase FadM